VARILVLTGTPGTGKTYFSNKLEKALQGKRVLVVHANEIAKAYAFSKDKYGSQIINMHKLANALNHIISSNANAYDFIIFEGHLLCDIRIRRAIAIVLREHLSILLQRLRARKYPAGKINENIVAEALDYCGQHAERNYTQVVELIASDKGTLKKLISIAKGRQVKTKPIELLEELVSIMRKQKNFSI